MTVLEDIRSLLLDLRWKLFGAPESNYRCITLAVEAAEQERLEAAWDDWRQRPDKPMSHDEYEQQKKLIAQHEAEQEAINRLHWDDVPEGYKLTR